MKDTILKSGIVILLLNILLGFILSFYPWFNVIASSLTICITCLAVHYLSCMDIKDPFKISLSLVFTGAGVIQFLMSLIMPSRFTNNWGLIIIAILMAIEALLLIMVITTNRMSGK